MRPKAIASILTDRECRLHLHLPQPAAHRHDKVVGLAIAPGFGHSKSHPRRLRQKRRLRHPPSRFAVIRCAVDPHCAHCCRTNLTAASEPSTSEPSTPAPSARRLFFFFCAFPFRRFSASPHNSPTSATAIKSPTITPLPIRSLSKHCHPRVRSCLRTKDLGEPRDASRTVRGNTRAFGSLPFCGCPILFAPFAKGWGITLPYNFPRPLSSWSSQLLRTKDLGGPRDVSRPVRGNNRAFGPLPFWGPSPPVSAVPQNTKAPSDVQVRGGLFCQVGYTKIILNIGNPSQVKSATAQTLPKTEKLR